MGRKVKRVSMDFDWPLGVVWPGYLLSVCKAVDEDCETCKKFTKIVTGEDSDACKTNLIPNLEPPTGDGWQMWEDCTEGSPMSPVFESAKQLAYWLDDTGASTFGRMTATYDQWLKMIEGPGFAFSAVSDEKGLRSGVEFASEDIEQ